MTAAGRSARATRARMSTSWDGRERRPEGVFWLHVSYVQYDKSVGVKETFGRNSIFFIVRELDGIC